MTRLLLTLLDRLEETLISSFMAAATLLIFVAVTQRYSISNAIALANWGHAHGQEWLFHAGRSVFLLLRQVDLTWAQELCVYLFIWMAKFGAAYGVRRGIHVGVDVLVKLVEERARKPVILFALLSGALFTSAIGAFGSVFVYNLAHTDETSADLELPMWMVYLAIPAGSWLMCFRFLQAALNFARSGELPGHAHAHDSPTVPGIGITPSQEPPRLAVLPKGAAR
jgi:TRAP-type C4-dicarboxylate transport system permease small subunit